MKAASAPPTARDGVRLLVARPGEVHHEHFDRIGAHLSAGDLVVVNTSGTLSAAVDATRADGRPVTVHFATALDGGDWVVEVRPRRNAPVLLHTGVSSQDAGEPPQPERFRVSEPTARLVNMTRAWGGRVVAVGTTVTRALESAADADGVVRASAGWTDLVLGDDHPARVVGGLVTGWHEPGASHLHLLEAVAGSDLVDAAYAEAERADYLWHEFGDSCLLLPDRVAA